MSSADKERKNQVSGGLRQGLSPARVLVAEDSRVAYAVLEDILAAEGVETCRVNSLAGTLEQIENFAPKLLILSHWLPEGDTLGLLHKLQNGPLKTLPTIVTLTSDALDEGIRAINAGAFDCIYKPFQRADLLSRVYRALGSTQAVGPPDATEILPDAADMVYTSELFEPLLDALEAQFRSKTSHELRQPLEALLLFSQSIEAEKGAVDVRKALDVFRTFLTAAKSLVTNTAPSKLFSCLESDSNQGWKRRVDQQDEAVVQAHLQFGSEDSSAKKHVQVGEKKVG